MANLNSIRCCGFDKGYDTLVKSRNGCLNDKALYSSALFSYQVSALSSYVEGVCLTQKQYSDAYQKALLNCGCCMKDIESPKGLPPPQPCYFYLHIICTPDLNFVDWEIDGQPFIANVNNLTGNSVFINSTAFQNEVFIWTIDDIDNLPTIPSYTDSNGNPSVYPIQWIQGQCYPICVQSIIPQLDIFSAPTLIRFIQPGLEYWSVAGIECSFTIGGNLDLSNPTSIASANGFFQSLYPGSLLSVTDDGFGNWIVELSNVYNHLQIVFEDQYGTLYYFDETPC